jgi:hypothetical protein
LFLFSQIERKRAIASSDRWSGFGFGDAKLSFGKDSLRLGACVTIPNIRYFDPLSWRPTVSTWLMPRSFTRTPKPLRLLSM